MAKIDGSEEAFQDYGASVFALPFFNCCKLQIGVAIRSEMVVQIGGVNIGVKFCAEVLGVGTTVQVVVIRHVNKDLVKSYYKVLFLMIIPFASGQVLRRQMGIVRHCRYIRSCSGRWESICL